MKGAILVLAFALCLGTVPLAAADPIDDIRDDPLSVCRPLCGDLGDGPEPTSCRPYCLTDDE